MELRQPNLIILPLAELQQPNLIRPPPNMELRQPTFPNKEAKSNARAFLLT